MVSVIFASPATDPLVVGVRVVFVIFVIPVVSVKRTGLQNIGSAKPRFIEIPDNMPILTPGCKPSPGSKLGN